MREPCFRPPEQQSSVRLRTAYQFGLEDFIGFATQATSSLPAGYALPVGWARGI